MIRLARPGDMNFVKKTWFKDYRACAVPTLMPLAVYATRYRDLVSEMAAASTVLVAADEQDDDVILGWAAASTSGVLHYLFVRPISRRRGVARALLTELGSLPVHSHTTPDWARTIEALGLRTTYDPFAAWRFDERRQEPQARQGADHR